MLPIPVVATRCPQLLARSEHAHRGCRRRDRWTGPGCRPTSARVRRDGLRTRRRRGGDRRLPHHARRPGPGVVAEDGCAQPIRKTAGVGIGSAAAGARRVLGPTRSATGAGTGYERESRRGHRPGHSANSSGRGGRRRPCVGTDRVRHRLQRRRQPTGRVLRRVDPRVRPAGGRGRYPLTGGPSPGRQPDQRTGRHRRLLRAHRRRRPQSV